MTSWIFHVVVVADRKRASIDFRDSDSLFRSLTELAIAEPGAVPSWVSWSDGWDHTFRRCDIEFPNGRVVSGGCWRKCVVNELSLEQIMSIKPEKGEINRFQKRLNFYAIAMMFEAIDSTATFCSLISGFVLVIQIHRGATLSDNELG